MDPHAMQARVDELMADFHRLRDGASGLQQTLQAIRCTARSRDGLVTVTVGARGDVVSLDLDPRLYRSPDSKALAASIVSTIQAAAAEAADKVTEACSSLMPAEDVRAQMDMNFESLFRRMDDNLDLGGGTR